MLRRRIMRCVWSPSCQKTRVPDGDWALPIKAVVIKQVHEGTRLLSTRVTIMAGMVASGGAAAAQAQHAHEKQCRRFGGFPMICGRGWLRSWPNETRPSPQGADASMPARSPMPSSSGSRPGCQWKQFPGDFPDESSVQRTFQRWVQLGLFDQIWVALVEACAELGVFDS
jgi:hypothetical protein